MRQICTIIHTYCTHFIRNKRIHVVIIWESFKSPYFKTLVKKFAGIDEILDLEKISRGNGPFFSISSWRIEFSFLEMLSNVKILKKKFSFSSRNSRFWKKFSFTSRKNEILQTDSLSLLDSSLNVFSNSREKSYFALWVDFDHQCFAERESILKRQFCVVEQYSDSSVYKSTSWRLLWPRVISGSILNGCPVERAYAKHARMRS